MPHLISQPASELIPQKQPFVLITELTGHDEQQTSSSFHISQDHLLVEAGFLSSYGIIENMAQTAALRSGYAAALKGEKPPVGFIGTITSAKIAFLPLAGSVIYTTATQITQIMNIIVIKAICKQGDKIMAECDMKIVIIE